MKKLTLMTLLALAGIGSSALAYDYTIVNKTNQKITVSITPTLGPTYSWVLAPSGTTIPASQAAPSSLVVPPGIDDIPGTEFGDTKVFQFTGINSGLCLNTGSLKVNEKTVEGIYANEDKGDDWGVVVSAVTLGQSIPVEIAFNLCGDKTIYIKSKSGVFYATVK